MGRVITEGYDDWLEMAGNLHKARKSWGWMSRVFDLGGGGSEGVGSLLQGVSPGGVSVLSEFVDRDPQDIEGPE